MESQKRHGRKAASANESASRRIHIDEWRRMPLGERDALVFQVIERVTGSRVDVVIPQYTSDAAAAIAVLTDAAREGRITRFAMEFDLLPEAWSVIVDVPICRGLTATEHTVADTFSEAVVMAVLRAYDVDFVSSNDELVGTPKTKRAITTLLHHMSHALTDELSDGWRDDLVRAFGRLRHPEDMTEYDLAMWMYGVLARMRGKERRRAAHKQQ